ncbi:hypothetical protein E2542_SST06630 [Spatholobus suberectus]|nr:hypothetical protein E2542_SST06630 [Spatholobus suberectus]
MSSSLSTPENVVASTLLASVLHSLSARTRRDGVEQLWKLEHLGKITTEPESDLCFKVRRLDGAGGVASRPRNVLALPYSLLRFALELHHCLRISDWLVPFGGGDPFSSLDV